MPGAEQAVRIDRRVYQVIRSATVIREPRLWSDAEIVSARRQLQAQFQREPTLEELAAQYGAEVVGAVVKQVVANRMAELEQAERVGDGSPCHLCGAPRTALDPSYPFGLARVLEEKTEWGTAGAALALNLLTLPFGVAVGARPGKSMRAQIAHCRLVLCAVCGKSRERLFGGLRIREADCARHPSWNRLKADGFDRFLDEKALAQFH